MIRSAIKQRGNFTIEFALVGVIFSLLLVFSGDVIIKLSVKGKLDRLSFSLVNVLKERTQLFDEDYQITSSEAKSINEIARNSLRRTLMTYENDRLGVLVEELTFSDIGTPNILKSFSYEGGCVVTNTLAELEYLSVITSWDRQASLYRVTACYETDNWSGELLGEEFTTVSSSSVIIGR